MIESTYAHRIDQQNGNDLVSKILGSGLMANQRCYWVNSFTLKTWEEAQRAGGGISGFRTPSKMLFETLSKGDYFLCYILRLKRFIAVQEVVESQNKWTVFF